MISLVKKLSAANAPKYHSDSAGRRGFMWILRRLLIKTAPPPRGGTKARIIVERVYNGTQDMEEIFRSVNEQNAIRNIRAMMENNTASDGTESA